MVRNMTKNERFLITDLQFRKIREKERMLFYNYAFESTKDRANTIGISFEFLEKFCKINNILLGLPGKLLMRNVIDYVTEVEGEIAAGFTIIYDKKKNKYSLGNVFTRPKFQGRGLGNIVMQYVISLYGNKTIDLGVDRINTIAIHLYEKYGFKEESLENEYLGELPFPKINPPEGYTTRLAEKSDLNNLHKLKELPDMQNIDKNYSKTFNKTKKKKLRITNQFPGILLKEDQVVGIGRALWNRGVPDTAQIIASAVLPEAAEAYASFISFLANKSHEYGLKKYIWNQNKNTKHFSTIMEPILGEPFRSGLIMKRVATK